MTIPRLQLLDVEPAMEFTFHHPTELDYNGKTKSDRRLVTVTVPPVYCLSSGQTSLNLVQLWSTNYSHWLFDTVGDTTWFERLFGSEIKKWQVWTEKSPAPHVSSTLSTMGFTTWAPYKFNTPGADAFLFQTNTILNRNRRSNVIHPTIMEGLRANLPMVAPTQIILVQRSKLGDGPSQSRNIVNRDELLSRIPGLTTVYLESMSFQEQVTVFRGAKLIIAVHGAGLANVIFCTKGASLIEIRHPVFHQDTFSGPASVAGMNHVLVDSATSKTVPDQPEMQQPILVNVDTLVRLVERAL